MKLGNYSYLTLLPSEEGERRLLWQYKLRGIRKGMYYCCISLLIVFLFTLIIFLFGRTFDLLVYVFITMLASSVFGLIYCISKKSDMFVYLLPGFRLVIHIAYVYLSRGLVFNGTECSYTAIFLLMMDETYFNLSYLFDVLFLSPGLKISLLLYTPIFFGVHSAQVLTRFESIDMQSVFLKAGIVGLNFTLIFLVYYLLNLSDVIRFQEHQLTAKKELQLRHLLNVQSNAILVIEDTQREQADQEKCCTPEINVQLCNSKSIELFGLDLQAVEAKVIEGIKLAQHVNGSDSEISSRELSLSQLLLKRQDTG